MRAVMLLNFFVNFLLLMGTERLAGDCGALYRTVGAAALGAAYAGSCMLPELAFLSGVHWHAASLALMSALAFGIDRRAWKQGGIFTLLTMALAGTALMTGGGALPVAAAALGVRALSQFSLAGKRLLPVEIAGFGKTVRLTALQDTGNELRDPITGEQVLVIGQAAAGALTGLTAEQLRNPVATMAGAALPGLRLIPYRAVGQENGMLLAMRFPKVRIGGREQSGIVAFAPQSLGGEGYQALAGGVV